MCVGRAGVLIAGDASDQVTCLETLDDVRQSGERRVGATSQVRHPQQPARSLGEHGEHQVLEVRQAAISAQLVFQDARQQLDQGLELHPGGELFLIQPRRSHDHKPSR